MNKDNRMTKYEWNEEFYNEIIKDWNYRFPDDWYFINDKDSLDNNIQQTQSDYAKCYKPYRTLHNY